ncbi:Ribose import ATP-binding protein RbsA [compost metagenome]
MLQLSDVKMNSKDGVPLLNGLNLEVKAGEIVGIAGVDGNGQTELIEAITGLRKIDSGTIKAGGRDITNQSARAIAESGVAHIPEDRHKHGLVLDFSVSENMVLKTYYQAPYSKGGFLNRSAMEEHARNLVDRYDVRTPSIETKVRSMSGGNQQKAIIAREIEMDPELLIAAQPTRGLDVGAIEAVHRQLVEQRDMGKAVLLISFELQEIMNVSDRIAVIFEGKIVGEVLPQDTNDQELGLMMGGMLETGGTDG